MSSDVSGLVVWSLSQYLRRKAEVGGAAFDAQMENLLGLIEAKLVEPYAAEMFARFRAEPTDDVETETLRLHLAREISRDPEFGQQLSTNLGGPMTKKRPGKGRTRLILASAATVAAVAVAVLLARTTGTETAAPPPVTVTTGVPVTETVLLTTTSTSAPAGTTTVSASSSVPAAEAPGVPGDGSTLSKGSAVFLSDLPRPNDYWNFEHGDHDVQITQYQDSLWNLLNTCNSDRYSGEQQFRLKNFSRIEVKAVGTDSTSDASLAVKFEIFVNNDLIHPIVAEVVNPGEAKPLGVDLPANTFALTLRTSLTTVDKSTCRRGNAVWGTPHVLAAGR